VLRKARENAEKPSKSSAAKLYKAPTKTPEEIAASVPGGVAAVEKTKVRLGALSMTDNPPEQGGFKQANGTYLPERAVVHERIVQEYINPETVAKYTPKPGESPLLTILGGRGGSGKSWLTSKDGPIDTSTSLVLDADEIKSKLPGYEGWNAALYHEESSDIVAMIDQRAAQIGMNVVLDGTLKSENIQKRIDVYQAPPSHDYEMEGYYMYASPETAATRAMQRFATQKGDFSGRFVPAEVILGNVNNEKNFDKMSEGFRKWAVYDNDADERGKPPKLVEQGGRKRVR
jgi:predicted ABC-type ATPase